MRRTLILALCFLAVVVPAAAADVPYGDFVFNGIVSKIAPSPDGVFVAGTFTREQAATGGALASTDGGSGAPDPTRFPKVAGSVLAVASDGAGGWFIGGGFTSVGGVPRDGLAHVRADGTVDPAWDPGVDRVAFGTGLGSHVNAIAVMGGTVYVGGSFGTIGTELRYELAAIDATTGAVRAFDADVDDVVQALAVSGSTLYIAGAFAHVGGEARTLFAAVDATTGAVKPWDPAPNTANRHAYAIAVSGSTVYVSGDFTQIGGQARAGLAAVDATTAALRTMFDPAPMNVVYALAASGPTVYLGGHTENVVLGDLRPAGAAAFNAGDGTLTPFAPAPEGIVYGLAADDRAVYLGGQFASLDRHVTGPFGAIDLAPPTIAIGTPAQGQQVALGSTVAASFGCEDAVSPGSGIATCAAPAVVDTTALGPHTVTVTATDKSGHTTSRSVDYVVVSPSAGGGGAAPGSGGGTGSGGGAGGVKKPTLSAASVFSVPSTRSCASRRAFRVRLHTPKGTTLRKVTVKVNGKLKTTVTGKKLSAPVDLRGLPKGTFTLTIAATTSDGRTVKLTKRYKTCAKKERKGRPKR